MQKKYLAISTWVDKETGVPKTTLAELMQGTNKSGKMYQITDTKSTIMVDEEYPAGTILTYDMTLTTATASSGKPTSTLNLKSSVQ